MRRSVLVTLAAVVALAGCGSDGLEPDVDNDDIETETPGTDTRTVDPPTASNLETTEP